MLMIDTPRQKKFWLEGLERRWRHPRERVPDQRHIKTIPHPICWVGLVWEGRKG
jgi:hypothetical protein